MRQDTLIEIKAEGKCFLAGAVESCASPAEQSQQLLLPAPWRSRERLLATTVRRYPSVCTGANAPNGICAMKREAAD
jgi:hypothetical protein